MPQDDFIAYLRELLEPAGKVSARAMFGGWGVYLDGIIMGIVIDGRLYLKADEITQPRFVESGNAPFMYSTPAGPVAMSYWSVPDEAMDSSEAMAPWARLAMDAAKRKTVATRPRSLAGKKSSGPKPTTLAVRRDAGQVPPAATKRASPAKRHR